MDEPKNLAFVDGQNLYLGTKQNGWAIDHERFRDYEKIGGTGAF